MLTKPRVRAICVISLFICIFCTFYGFSVSASAEIQTPTVVRVGYYQLNGFQEYDENTGEYSGYSYEFLMALQQYENLVYEFVPCERFSKGLAMLEAGEIDILNNVTKTSEREEIYDFTTLSAGENTAFLVMPAGDTRVGYGDYASLKTIKIGLSPDSIYSQKLIDTLTEKNVDANIVWYDTRAEVVSAFKNNEVDAYVITSSNSNNEHVILSFAPDAYYIAVAKGNKEVVRMLDSAITSLRANNPYFEVHLKEKYYRKSSENYTVLTKSEKEFIKENPVVRVTYQPEWQPISYMDNNGEFAGAVRDVYDLITERTGLQFEFVPLDNNDTSNNITSKYGTLIMAELPTDFNSAEIYNVRLTQAFITPTIMEVANAKLTDGDTISLVNDDYLSKLCKRIYGDTYNYVYCETVDECIEMVRKQKADGTVLLSYESEYYRSKIQYSRLVYTIIDTGSYSLSIAVANDADIRLYQIMQKGLNAISESEIINIFNTNASKTSTDDLLTYVSKNPLMSFIFAVIFIGLLITLVLCGFFMGKLKKANRQIEIQRDDLEEALQAKSEFLSRMSHEIRTPLNSILGGVHLAKIKDEEHNDNTKELELVEQSGQFLLNLINDILDVSRIEANKIELHKEWCSPVKILAVAINMMEPIMEKNGINFVYPKVNDNNYEVEWYVDPRRIEQLLINLLNNAAKFTQSGGTVTLSITNVSCDDKIATDRVIITDTGCGMTKEFVSHIGEAFSQEQNEYSNKVSDSGLGLFIVKKIIEIMGGKLVVESELGKGSTFSFTVTYEYRKKENTQPKEVVAQDTVSISGMKVLYAEDNEMNQIIGKKLLESKGVIVEIVDDGEKALQAFCNSKPDTVDAIIMDIRMPVMNGLEATESIRKLDRTDAKTIPIIALSADAIPEEVEKAMSAGLTDYLTKPIEPNILYQTLEKWRKK